MRLVDAQQVVHGVAHVGEDVAVIVGDVLVGGVDQRGIGLLMGDLRGFVRRDGIRFGVRHVLRQAVDRGLVDIVQRVLVGVCRQRAIERRLRISDRLVGRGGVGFRGLGRQLRFLVGGDLADARIGIALASAVSERAPRSARPAWGPSSSSKSSSSKSSSLSSKSSLSADLSFLFLVLVVTISVAVAMTWPFPSPAQAWGTGRRSTVETDGIAVSSRTAIPAERRRGRRWVDRMCIASLCC